MARGQAELTDVVLAVLTTLHAVVCRAFPDERPRFFLGSAEALEIRGGATVRGGAQRPAGQDARREVINCADDGFGGCESSRGEKGNGDGGLHGVLTGW